MTSATILLGCLIALLMGAAFHLWKGGSFARMLLYLILAQVGFWLGHLAGSLLNFETGMVGGLYLPTAVLVCAAVLYLGYQLSLLPSLDG